jgi:TRAP-type C4-dicarboxylate transport system permease large subunit
VLIPPSIAFIVYSVMVPGASVPALFAAGMVPGILAGLALIVPAVWLSRRHGLGAAERELPRPPFWRSLREASWGLAAPVLILGGDPGDNWDAAFADWARALEQPTVRGLVIGRALLFPPDGDVASAVTRAAALVRPGGSA